MVPVAQETASCPLLSAYISQLCSDTFWSLCSSADTPAKAVQTKAVMAGGNTQQEFPPRNCSFSSQDTTHKRCVPQSSTFCRTSSATHCPLLPSASPAATPDPLPSSATKNFHIKLPPSLLYSQDPGSVSPHCAWPGALCSSNLLNYFGPHLQLLWRISLWGLLCPDYTPGLWSRDFSWWTQWQLLDGWDISAG